VNDVLGAEPIEQIARRSADELEGAAGKDLRAELRGPPGDEGGAGRRLAHHRHSREHRAGGLLAGAPGGEVEGVDVDGDAVPGNPEMDASVPRRPAQLHGLAVAQGAERSELRAELRVMRERRDRAVDVELRVSARVAAVLHREADQLVARRMHRLAPGLQKLAALGERELPQCGPAL